MDDEVAAPGKAGAGDARGSDRERESVCVCVERKR